MKRLYYILYILLAVTLAGCEDKLDYNGGVIPDGDSYATFSVGFSNFEPALDDSRSSGTAIKTIDKLWIVIYNTDGTLYDYQKIGDYKLVQNSRPDGSESSETETGHAEFQMMIRNGKYRMYAVANCELTADDVASEEALRNKKLSWQNKELTGNPGQPNSEMFGYFTNNVKGDIDDTKGFVAPTVVVDGTKPLHAWVKRAASKLTVAFDTSNLKENVFIYIKSIQVKDIPEENYLGRTNTPGEQGREISSKLVDGETLYLANAKADDDPKTAHGRWRMIARGDSVWGMRSEVGEEAPVGTPINERIKREHVEKVASLYFYENSQPEGTINTESDKRQDVSGNNAQVTYPNGVNEKDPAWKDARRYGSYLEVQGYYVCEDNKRPGRGEILYRFMLGKNTTTDYDAERNHHYQLTMHFNGYANDIDWHIVYKEEEKPGLFTPDTTYVSYLYNQEAKTVVRATPRPGYKLTKLTAYILKNEWRPHSDDGVDLAEPVYNSKAWNMQMNGTDSYSGGATFNQQIDKECDPNCEFGFLSLRKVTRVDIDMKGGPSTDLSKKNYPTMVKNFRDSYSKNDNGDASKPKGKREFSVPPSETTGDGKLYEDETDGDYSVSYEIKNKGETNEEHNYIFDIPLYTRAKSLDKWGVYSGANPFYQHRRYAYLKFVAEYANVNDPSDVYSNTSYTNVLQARRIDNPRGIYRSGTNLDAFRVRLYYTLLNPSGADEFASVISRGPWTATIEVDETGLASISANGQTANAVGQSITGQSNTPIEFTYKPKHAQPDNGLSCGAVIKVTYHNNSCVHKIVVRQGYGPTKFDAGSLYWSAYNVYDTKTLTVNPLAQGSIFRRNTELGDPIAEVNSNTWGLGVNPGENAEFVINGSTTKKKWSKIDYMSSADVDKKAAFGSLTFNKISYKVPSVAESRQDLSENPDVNFAFGIVYGDGATKTLSTSDAYGFRDPSNNTKSSTKGVRGVVAYSLKNGRSIFFPFGAVGHARRKSREWGLTDQMAITFSAGNGLLRYGSVDVRLGGDMGQNGVWVVNGKTRDYRYNDYRPMAYNLPEQHGGAYWLGSAADKIAMDFNYGNYMTAELGIDDLFTEGNASDALPIKPARTSFSSQ